MENQAPALYAFLIIFALCVLLTPGLAQILNRPQRGILISTVGVGAIIVVSVGGVRWAVFGRAFTATPLILWLALALLAVLVLLGWIAYRRDLRFGAADYVRCVALIPIAALTLPPKDGSLAWQGNPVSQFGSFWSVGHETLIATLIFDIAPNAALYVLAGLAWSGVLGPWRAWLALTCVSLAIELYQAILTDRVAQVSDIVGNSSGAVLGVAIYLALGRAESSQNRGGVGIEPPAEAARSRRS